MCLANQNCSSRGRNSRKDMQIGCLWQTKYKLSSGLKQKTIVALSSKEKIEQKFRKQRVAEK